MQKNIEKLIKKIKLLKSKNNCANSLNKGKNECNHDFVLLLGSGSIKTYVCPVCGRCHNTMNFNNFENPFIESNVVDFRNNPLGAKMDNGKYVIQLAVRDAMEVAAYNNPDMTIGEFIESIPNDWYTSESILKAKIKGKRITK